MRIADRIEQNRQLAKVRRAENPIGNALAEVFGLECHKAAYERCLSSLRFPALCSLAANLRDHPQLWPQVVVLAKTLADNPKSRSYAYRKVTQ